eukprot:5727723-Prymnesium_polylepis.1
MSGFAATRVQRPALGALGVRGCSLTSPDPSGKKAAVGVSGRPRTRHQRRDTGADGLARYADGTRRLPVSPLNDTYLVPEAPQSRVALESTLRRTICHRPQVTQDTWRGLVTLVNTKG